VVATAARPHFGDPNLEEPSMIETEADPHANRIDPVPHEVG